MVLTNRPQMFLVALLLACSFAFPQEQNLKSYNNYDFVPGDKVLFDDDFSNAQDGEFPPYWDLEKGQAVVSKILDTPAFLITDGNYGKVFPRMKTKQYLPAEFTIEFDHTMPSVNKGYGIMLFLVNAAGKEGAIGFNDNNVTYNVQSKNLTSQLSDDIRAKKYLDKWNHIAIAYRNNQMKIYVNQYRILVVPNTEFAPVAVKFGGIGSQKSPITFTNVRIAEGGGMNMLEQLYKDGKLVTHGILFDVGKSVVKPASMGTINQIVKIMQQKSDLKLEIDGHTDSDGSDASNMKLSQDRADAVKAIIVEEGIDTSRLTTKGYGKTKPIADNKTPEGKANNRRVEFVKM